MSNIDTGSGDTQESPRVTVIVPTHNRASSLRRTLASLLTQEYPADRLEVVVVDNASSDHTEQVVREAQAGTAVALHYHRKENRGPAAARNFGLARSESDIVAFTDSDCTAAPDWVARGVRRMEADVGLVAGAIHPTWPRDRQLGFFQHQIPEIRRENAIYPTANVLYRRRAIEAVGGFDERFGAYRWGPPVGGEDTDLAWRVKRAGYRSVFAEDAGVYHEASALSAKHWLLEPLRVQVVPMLVARLPELRTRFLHYRCFADAAHPCFYLAVLGVALGLKKSPLLFLLAAPWFWLLRGFVAPDLRQPSRWWRVPVKYAFLFERFSLVTAALWVASVRHRTVVL